MNNDVFICGGTRTAIGSYGGSLSAVRPDDMAAHVIKSLMGDYSFDPTALDDVVLGCANQAGEDNRNVARMAALLGGLPESVSGVTVNRLCASGLDAVSTAARAIASGEAELILAGGVESMSRAPYVVSKAGSAFSRQVEMHDTTIGWRLANPLMAKQFGTDSMPETAENVAAEYKISRTDQDVFALRSQERAAAAISKGRFKKEITPIEVQISRKEKIIFDTDEHPRDTSLEKLAALPAPFRDGGSVTAGNASGVNDGAAVLLIASAAAAEKHKLKPLARIEASTAAGVTPRLMGIGPVPATQKLLTRLGRRIEDYDHIELNEAFAAQALAVMRQWKLADDSPQVNPNGGAIALGHPLGMSGARLALSAALELSMSKKQRALVTMCVGVGQGMALSLESVGAV